MDFNEVIGQHEAKARLKAMVDNGQVPHAIMLCGGAGQGKMALAMAMASYLLTEGSAKINPALNKTNAQAMLRVWSHPDLHFTYPVIKPTGTSSEHSMVSDDFAREWHDLIARGPYFTFNEWLDAMRAENKQAQIYEGESEALNRKLSLKSSQGGYKVSIIWLPERMHPSFANKILKLIEEPPQYTVFIFATEDPTQILETIRSRTQRIDIRRIATEDIEQALIARRAIDADTAHRIARTSDGSWTKAIDSLTADNETHEFFNYFVQLMRMAYKRDVKALKDWSEQVAPLGRERQKRFLDYLLRMVRENFMYNFHNPEISYMTAEEEQFATKFSKFVNEANVVEMTEEIEKVRKAVVQNANPRVEFFDLSLKIIMLLLKK